MHSHGHMRANNPNHSIARTKNDEDLHQISVGNYRTRAEEIFIELDNDSSLQQTGTGVVRIVI